jgi:hypothetical protein
MVETEDKHNKQNDLKRQPAKEEAVQRVWIFMVGISPSRQRCTVICNTVATTSPDNEHQQYRTCRKRCVDLGHHDHDRDGGYMAAEKNTGATMMYNY